MQRYVAGRLVQAVVTIFVVSLVTFVIIRQAPGGPAIIASPGITRQQIQEMEAQLGLTDPIHVQYVRWLGHLTQGEMGTSFNYSRPVLELLLDRLPNTLVLGGFSLVFAILVAVPLGMLSAVRRNGWFDYLAASVSLLGMSIPAFWLGIMAILVFSVNLGWLPSGGMRTVGADGGAWDLLKHLLMPGIVASTFMMGQLARFTRASVIATLREDYLRTARAKGLAERVVIYRHALRNALIPVVTVIGLGIPSLAMGAAITETVFAWPGMGRLAVEAATNQDYPLIMGITLFVSAVVVVVNLCIDLLYSRLDPRVRLS